MRMQKRDSGVTTSSNQRTEGSSSTQELSGPKRAVTVALAGVALAGGSAVFGATTAHAEEVPPLAPTTNSVEMCRVVFTAEKEVFKDTRAAAKMWNKHTEKLDSPYTIDVQKGDVDYAGGELHTGNGGPGAMEVSKKKFSKVLGGSGYSARVGNIAGLGGGSLNGIIINKDGRFQGKNAKRNVVAHEVGHVLGVGHDSKAGKLMSPIIKNGSLGITKRSLKDLEYQAPGIIDRYCGDTQPSVDDILTDGFTDMEMHAGKTGAGETAPHGHELGDQYGHDHQH